MKGLVFNIQKFCIHDGPGIRTSVFFKGCPLRCKWCANPESQNPFQELIWEEDKCVDCKRCEQICKSGIIAKQKQSVKVDRGTCEDCQECVSVCPSRALSIEGEYMEVDDIVKVCLDDLPFYEESGGGVTISGGEGMSQPDFAEALIQKLKEHNIHVAIETTGHVPKEVFRRLAPQVDLLLYDVKHYDSQKHREGTGVGNERILSNLKWALEQGLDVLVRIPVIPGFNNSAEDAVGFSELFKQLGVDTVELLPFHQFGEGKYDKLQMDYAYRGIPALHREDLDEFIEILSDSGLACAA